MPAAMTREFREARKFCAAVSPIDFRVTSFAAYLTGESLGVKRRILDLFAAFIFAESSAYRENRVELEQFDHYIMAERMRDILEAYGYRE